MRIQRGNFKIPHGARKVHIRDEVYHYLVKPHGKITFYIGEDVRLYAEHHEVLGMSFVEWGDNKRYHPHNIEVTPSKCKSYLEEHLERLLD